jgi:hypothetical protein
LASGLVDWVRARVALGYEPGAARAAPIEFIPEPPRQSRREPSSCANNDPYLDNGAMAIGALTPTYVGRAPYEEQSAAIEHVLDQMADVHRALPALRLVYFLGMQWSNERELAEARARLRLASALASGYQGIEFVGLCLPGPGKLRTLNSAIALAGTMHLKGLMWIDDDIRMEPHCLARLTARFVEKQGRGAVGATKIPWTGTTATSKFTGSAMNFPHGCCMLVETAVLAGGIPDRYPSDDVYVCFRLLAPRAQNPLEHLELVSDARCSYTAGGRFVPTIAKVRRILLNQHVYLADWPRETARCYFQHVLFSGLWPLASWDGARGVRVGITKLLLQWLYFVFFLLAGAELMLRGLLRIPLRRIGWN